MPIQVKLYLVVLFLKVLQENSCSAQICPLLRAPSFGSLQCSGYKMNDRCVVQCNPGYRLVDPSSNIRQCVCLNVNSRLCIWSGDDSMCRSVSAACPSPTLTGNTYNIVDAAPQGAIVKVTITPTAKASSGWSVIVIFTNALPQRSQVRSYSMLVSAISPDRKAVTFRNRAHNIDISTRRFYKVTFMIESPEFGISPESLKAIVGFYDTPIFDGSCFSQVNPITTTDVPTTISRTTTAVTSSSTMNAVATTNGQPAAQTPSGCQEIEYLIDNPGWNARNGWNFIFRYKVPVGNYENWTIKIEFSTAVTEVTAYDSITNGPFRDGRIWMLKPRSWNQVMRNQQMDAIGMSVTSARSAPSGYGIICNKGVVPGMSLQEESSSIPATTTPTAATLPVTVMSTLANTLNITGPSGVLPPSPAQTVPNFKPSPITAEYNFNELLHKSILFYEAQRSGELPGINRIPWRGDSGLKDGCVKGVCKVDLTGGWYDAGDFMKFGFPMAWSVTVLAWGMIEFESGYRDAGEWNNALSMLRWATDYLVKAHVAPNVLYFQVGNPKVDHTNWGHPETMTMERPIFKIDTSNPGTEVAGETAAALAASAIVFQNLNSAYSSNLLNHAIQLYNFAQTYRGHYHISVPESGVGEFYRSYSGYNDELMWSAMWLYKATGNRRYLDDAIQQVNYVSNAEFSWDQKGLGALVLLSQERSEYKSNLFAGINFVMSKKKTPGGLVHFSDWGSNRYAANYALITLLTAKMQGTSSSLGKQYYSLAKDQISRMLGQGDGQRSYVVGFGVDSPRQPHHRASSCRVWTADPSTQICDWSDRDANRPNPFILYGALVGGPTLTGYYVDDRKSFVSNEIALDYNAGFQSAIAGLKYFEMKGVSS